VTDDSDPVSTLFAASCGQIATSVPGEFHETLVLHPPGDTISAWTATWGP